MVYSQVESSETTKNSNEQSQRNPRQGRAQRGRAGHGMEGQGRAWKGRAGQDRVEHSRAGQGRAEQGRAGQDRAGEGRAKQGMARRGEARWLEWADISLLHSVLFARRDAIVNQSFYPCELGKGCGMHQSPPIHINFTHLQTKSTRELFVWSHLC